MGIKGIFARIDMAEERDEEKQKKVKAMTLEQVDKKILRVRNNIDKWETKCRIYSSSYEYRNLFKYKEALEEWEKIRAAKVAGEDDEEELEEAEENKKLDEVLEQSYWNTSNNTGDTFKLTGEGEEKTLDEEMKETFGDDDPEAVYEAERETVKDWDNIYGEISEQEAKGLAGADWDAINRSLSGDKGYTMPKMERWGKKLDKIKANKNVLRIDKEVAEQIQKLQELKVLKKNKKYFDLREVKKDLEEKIRKGVKKLEKQRSLIEKRDERDKWKMWNKGVNHYLRRGRVSSGEGGILSYTVQKFR